MHVHVFLHAVKKEKKFHSNWAQCAQESNETFDEFEHIEHFPQSRHVFNEEFVLRDDVLTLCV